MFYRKRFTGSIESSSGTVKVLIPGSGSTTRVTFYRNQTYVLTDALAEVLSKVYETKVIATRAEDYIGTLMISAYDNRALEFVIGYTSATVWSFYSAYTTAIVSCSSGAAYQPFNGLNYDFYITVKGDPKGCLDVYIGSYNTPAQTSYGFRICKGKNLKTNENATFYGNVSTSNALYPRGEFGGLIDGIAGNATISLATSLSSNSNLATFTNSNEYLPLIKTYSTDGMFTLDNCYISHNSMSSNTFYYLNGEVYYKNNMYIITKCTTMIDS